MFAHSIWTDGIAHAQEQLSPTQQNSDARLVADVVYWQAIKDGEDAQYFEYYLEQFPDGRFVSLAHRRLTDAKNAAIGRALLASVGGDLADAVLNAAYMNDTGALEWFKAQGAINARSLIGRTPMHNAAETNAVDAMKMLKLQEADINAQSLIGRTPMHLAAMSDAVAAMEWLKAQGADINAKDSLDQTSMHLAARGNATAAMEWLNSQGADINARDNDGQTPMHHAAYRGRTYEWNGKVS